MVRVTAAVIERGGEVLVCKRKAGGPFGGRWEFPGGKVEPGETPEAALAREIREELGLEIAVGEPVGDFPFPESAPAFILSAYRASLLGGEVRLSDHDEARWARPAELREGEFSPADVPIVGILKRPGGWA